jgi:hypothetical protein
VKYGIGVRAIVYVIEEIRNGCRRCIVKQVDLEITHYSLEFNDGCVRNSWRTTESDRKEKNSNRVNKGTSTHDVSCNPFAGTVQTKMSRGFYTAAGEKEKPTGPHTIC